MRIWLFSPLENSPGNLLFEEEGKRRGHDIRLYKPGLASFSLLDRMEIAPSLVFARAGGDSSESDIAELAILSRLGIPCLNDPLSLMAARHKGVAYARLSTAGVPVPRTVLLGGELETALESIDGPPWVLKRPLSTKGRGVCLVESLRSLRSVWDSLRTRGEGILLQEFLSEASCSDTRIVVFGGKAVAAARRTAGSRDEFRSNVYLGGRAEVLDVPRDWEILAEKAASALGLEIAGVDLIQGPAGPLVLEVNSSPGLQACPSLPRQLFDFLETKARSSPDSRIRGSDR